MHWEGGMESKNTVADTKDASVTPTIKMYQDIVDRAHTEVEHVRKVYAWLAGSIAIIVSTSIASYTFLSYKNFQEMRADLKNEVEFMKKRATQDYAVLASELKASVESKSHSVEKAVNSRIDSEFDDKNIKELVKSSAQERIDVVADRYIEKHISNKITPKISSVENNIKLLESTVEFNRVSSAALSDDRYAFNALRKMQKDKTYVFNGKASEIVNYIVNTKDTLFSYAVEYHYPWKDGINPSKMADYELRKQYLSDILPGFRVTFIEDISARSDIATNIKLELLYIALKTDINLDVVLHAARLFNKITGQKFDIYDTDHVIEWYEQYRSTIN